MCPSHGGTRRRLEGLGVASHRRNGHPPVAREPHATPRAARQSGRCCAIGLAEAAEVDHLLGPAFYESADYEGRRRTRLARCEAHTKTWTPAGRHRTPFGRCAEAQDVREVGQRRLDCRAARRGNGGHLVAAPASAGRYCLGMKVRVAVLRSSPERVVPPAGLYNRYIEPWELFDFPDEYLLSNADVPWDDRPSVSLEVDDDTPVTDVLEAAASKLGVSFTREAEDFFDRMGGMAYRTQRIVFADNRGMPVHLEAVADQAGRASFEFFPDDVRFSDVVATRREALFRGDPDRLFLVVDPYPGSEGGGGNGFSLWANVIDLYQNLEPWLKAAGVIGGALSVGSKGLKFAQNAAAIFRRHAPGFERRAIGLTQVELLANMAADPSALARHLGVKSSDAAQLLITLGLADDPSPDSPQLGRNERRAVLIVAKVATHFHLGDDHLRESAKRALLLPFDGDEAAFEASVTAIFAEFERAALER